MAPRVEEEGIHTDQLLRNRKTTCNNDALAETSLSEEPCAANLLDIGLLLKCSKKLICLQLHVSLPDSFQRCSARPKPSRSITE